MAGDNSSGSMLLRVIISEKLVSMAVSLIVLHPLEPPDEISEKLVSMAAYLGVLFAFYLKYNFRKTS